MLAQGKVFQNTGDAHGYCTVSSHYNVGSCHITYKWNILQYGVGHPSKNEIISIQTDKEDVPHAWEYVTLVTYKEWYTKKLGLYEITLIPVTITILLPASLPPSIFFWRCMNTSLSVSVMSAVDFIHGLSTHTSRMGWRFHSCCSVIPAGNTVTTNKHKALKQM